MTIGEPPTAARVRHPPRPQAPRQRQQRQPRPLFDNLTTQPAQRHQRPAKGQRRRARLTGAPATATAATGAIQTATAARTTRNLSRPRQRQPRAARKGHARGKDRPTPATPPQGPKTATAGKVCTKSANAAARPPHWTPATTANAGTAAQALPIFKAQTDHTAQRPDESRTGGGQPEACQV